MPKKQRQIIIWSIVAIIIIIIIIVIAVRHHHSGSTVSQTSGSAAPVSQSSPSTTPSTIKAPPPSAVYTALVKEYVNRRIQFEPNCQVSPNNVTFKNPVTLMLDNRSPQPAKVVLASRTYNLGAWGYYITTINQTGLPKNNLVDCNTSKNVAQILIQK